MRVVELGPSFGLDNLTMTEREPTPLGPNEVRLRMLAATLNYRDLLTIHGLYNPRQELPLVPLSDGCGQVVEVGSNVTRVAIGDRVCPSFVQQWYSGRPTRSELRSTLGGPLDGTLAEQMVLDERGLCRVPEYLTHVEAAALPCAALTAWSALVTQAELAPGDTVLVQGTGGVSMFALQIARMRGARVIVTSSSDDKLERVRAMGAWQTINYREDPDWGRTARKMSDGGVDHVIEVGGAGTLQQSIRATGIFGTISLIGVLTGRSEPLDIAPVLMQNIRLQGIMLAARDEFERMLAAFEHHQIRPPMDETFEFSDFRAAMDRMAAGQHFGKIAISLE